MSIVTAATLSMLTILAPTQAVAEDPRASLTPKQLNQSYYGGHSNKGNKYRTHKKQYKRHKKAMRVRKQVPAYHYNDGEISYYNGNAYEHHLKHSDHYNK